MAAGGELKPGQRVHRDGVGRDPGHVATHGPGCASRVRPAAPLQSAVLEQRADAREEPGQVSALERTPDRQVEHLTFRLGPAG